MLSFSVAATAILEQLFNASDIAVVGNFTETGKNIAIAAVGANSSIISLFEAAIATVISNTISSILLLRCLIKTQESIHVEWRELRIDGKTLRQIMKIGLPAGIQSAVFAISNIVIQSSINSLGTVIMASSSAAYNIEISCFWRNE